VHFLGHILICFQHRDRVSEIFVREHWAFDNIALLTFSLGVKVMLFAFFDFSPKSNTPFVTNTDRSQPLQRNQEICKRGLKNNYYNYSTDLYKSKDTNEK